MGSSRSNILTFLQLDIACLTLSKGPKLAKINQRHPEIILLSESNLSDQASISSYENTNRSIIWQSRNGVGRFVGMGYAVAGRAGKPRKTQQNDEDLSLGNNLISVRPTGGE